ncbi:hypothetical protein [Rhodopirellula sallentina]|uniref:Uncharacterized protein n=1 Tax=Rhodopirellula sallentina SM41 TaxID=1263870 RepID=M5U9X1_9BACT|nr:hypothetical protein [Rhodopirellula sallentina]EMI58212.1 hypothetical protein RSSM_00344 [Rhodopirellula sallentina SM41]
MKTVPSNLTDPTLDGLVLDCNEVQSTLHHSRCPPVSHSESGPLRWRESSNKRIAIPRDTVQFRFIVEMAQEDDHADVVEFSLFRRLSPNLILDRVVSAYIDGESVQPTNHSLNRTVDIHFHAVPSGSVIVVTYLARVHFAAETSLITAGDARVRWSYVSRSPRKQPNRTHHTAQHLAAPRGIRGFRPSLAKVPQPVVLG